MRFFLCGALFQEREKQSKFRWSKCGEPLFNQCGIFILKYVGTHARTHQPVGRAMLGFQPRSPAVAPFLLFLVLLVGPLVRIKICVNLGAAQGRQAVEGLEPPALGNNRTTTKPGSGLGGALGRVGASMGANLAPRKQPPSFRFATRCWHFFWFSPRESHPWRTCPLEDHLVPTMC